MIKLLVPVLGLLLLTGCATQTPSLEQTVPPTASALETETANDAPQEPLTAELVEEIVLRSYEKFEADGMTETVEADGETWKLVMDPTQPDYQAAWFNLTTGERELIFETDYFGIFIAYLQLDQEDMVISELEGGFRLQDGVYGENDYFFEGGLIVRGGFQDVQQTFEYSVDPELREGLEELAQELVDSF